MSTTAQRSGTPRVRRLLVRCALLLGSLALACAAAEVAVRLAGWSVPARGDAGAQGTVQPVPASVAQGVEFELRPGLTATATYPGADGEPARSVTYRVNELGFRGPPVPVEKRAGIFRIAALGDSFTYGTGVGEDETWPAQLAVRLRELAPERTIEVLNWGVPAYNTRQEVAQLNQRLHAYRPDLVVICAYINDASGEARAEGEHGEATWETRAVQCLGLTSGRWEEGAPMSPAQRRMMALRERSRLVDLVDYKLYGWLMGRVAARNYVADWAEGSPGLEMVRGALSYALVLSRREGFDLVAAIYPDLPSLGPPYAFAEQHAAFAALCSELGIPCQDLTAVFDGQDKRALQVHAHDKHPNAAAHRLAADALARFLLPRIEAR
jgi:lysophospholipase L1-like esterase